MSGTQQYAGTTITVAASEEIKKLAESSQKDYLEAHKNANGVQNKDNVPGFTVRCLCDESTNTASVVTPVGITKLATFAKLPKKTVIPGDDDNDSSSSDEDDGEGESGARETASSPALASSSNNSDSAASATAPNGSAVCGDPVSGDSLRTEKLRAALRELPNPRLLKLTTPASAWNVMFSPDLKYTSIVTDSLDVTVVPVGRPAEAFTVRAAAPSLQPSFSRIAAAFSSFSSSSTPPTPPRVLGCVWPYSDTFVVVTTETVEAYTVRGTRVTLAKAFCYKITWFKYSRKHRVILALVAQNTLQPLDFSIRGEYTKLSRIELVKAPESGFVPSEHVCVVDICGESFVAQLAWSEKKLPQPCITLIPFNKDLSVVRLLIPYGPERDGSVRFQSVDNLLVVHDLMHKVSFFYDLTLAGLPIIPCPVIVQPRQAAALAQEPVPAPVLCTFNLLCVCFGICVFFVYLSVCVYVL